MSHKSKIALYWPGDARRKPNELAAPNVEEATQQIERAVRKLGRETYRIEGFIEKPHEAIEKLGPVQDPLIGVCVHWFYGPHTTDGVVARTTPCSSPPTSRAAGPASWASSTRAPASRASAAHSPARGRARPT